MFVPIALSKDLPPKRVMRAMVGDQDLVVWRATSGHLSVWHNRCPHRGMRLSHGFVRGEALACLYHGWHYDKKGQCRYIPAHPELEPPATIRTETFTANERDGLIWVCVDHDETMPEVPKDLTPVRSMDFNATADQLKTALLSETCQKLSPFGRYGVDAKSSCGDMIDRFEITSEQGDQSLTFFVHHMPSNAIFVHILVSKQFDRDACISISRWMEAVRRQVEQIDQKVQSL